MLKMSKVIIFFSSIVLFLMMPVGLCYGQSHVIVKNPINNSDAILIDGVFAFFSPSEMDYSEEYIEQGGARIKAHRFLGFGGDGVYCFEYSLLKDKRYTVDYEKIGEEFIASLAAELKSTYKVLEKEVKYLDKCDMTGYELFFQFGGGEYFGHLFTGIKKDIRYLMVIVHNNGVSEKNANLYFNLLTVK
jgi:hypothetical protein